MKLQIRLATVILALLAASCAQAQQKKLPLKLVQDVPLTGKATRLDYQSFDATSGWLYIAQRAKLVAGRRDGKWTHYRIVEPKNKSAAEVFNGIMQMLREDKEMQTDRENLANVCCVPQAQKPVNIQGVSRPVVL